MVCLLPRSQLGLREKLSRFAKRTPNRPGYRISRSNRTEKICNVAVARRHIFSYFSFAMAYGYDELPLPDQTRELNSKHFSDVIFCNHFEAANQKPINFSLSLLLLGILIIFLQI